jgi:hypothetical protein
MIICTGCFDFSSPDVLITKSTKPHPAVPHYVYSQVSTGLTLVRYGLQVVRKHKTGSSARSIHKRSYRTWSVPVSFLAQPQYLDNLDIPISFRNGLQYIWTHRSSGVAHRHSVALPSASWKHSNQATSACEMRHIVCWYLKEKWRAEAFTRIFCFAVPTDNMLTNGSNPLSSIILSQM